MTIQLNSSANLGGQYEGGAPPLSPEAYSARQLISMGALNEADIPSWALDFHPMRYVNPETGAFSSTISGWNKPDPSTNTFQRYSLEGTPAGPAGVSAQIGDSWLDQLRDVGTTAAVIGGLMYGGAALGGTGGGGAAGTGGSYAAENFGTAAGYGGSNAGFNMPFAEVGAGAGAGMGSEYSPSGGSYAAENYGTAAGYGGETAPYNFPGAISGGTFSPGGSSPSGGTSFYDAAKGAFSSIGQGIQSIFSPSPSGGSGFKQGLGLLGAGLSLYSGYEGINAAEDLKRRANRGPGIYAQKLQELMTNPSILESTPGYQAGLQAVERKLASQGFTGSGNAKVALLKYGGDTYAQQVELLRRLASDEESQAMARVTPEIASTNVRGQGLASIGYGLYGLSEWLK